MQENGGQELPRTSAVPGACRGDRGDRDNLGDTGANELGTKLLAVAECSVGSRSIMKLIPVAGSCSIHGGASSSRCRLPSASGGTTGFVVVVDGQVLLGAVLYSFTPFALDHRTFA